MKANKTRKLIECFNQMIINKHEHNKESTDSKYEALEELRDIEKAASLQDPLNIEDGDDDGVTFVCPSCYADNYKWIEYGLINAGAKAPRPKKVKFCQHCGQRIAWR